jgi:plastocyanin
VFKSLNLLAWVACGGIVAARSVCAATIELSVLDREGRGIPDVVAVALLRDAPAAVTAASAPAPAVMDQVERRFVPYILVVQTGTSVAFPNSDNVAHQVYSFSAAKRFQLALYRGHAHPPLVFDKPGLVVLGCNIHDDMLAYIYVTPSPYFGTTAADGRLALRGLPAGNYELRLWNPRFNEPQAEITRATELRQEESLALKVQLTRALAPEPRPKPTKAGWDDY